MIGRSRSRQALPQHSNSSALSDIEASSALLQSQKKKVLWGREEEEKGQCLKEAELAQIKANHHNHQEHEEQAKMEVK